MISFFVKSAGRFGLNPKEAERFLKFAVVGGIGFIVDFGIFNLLIGPFGNLLAGERPLHNYLLGLGLTAEQVALPIAGTISFIAAIISNFLWNRYWTYPDSRSKSKRRQFVMFAFINLLGIVIRLPILTFTHPFFAQLVSGVERLRPFVARIGENLALALAVVIVMFWNFFANRYWTYSDVD